MKKILVLAALIVSLGVNAQSVSTLVLSLLDESHTITPNEVIYVRTKANQSAIIAVDLANIGTTTNMYKVKRYDISLNNSALAYFCYGGNCFTETILVSPDADTLAPGQKASDLKGDYKLLTADLMEGPTVGPSEVRYTFFNTATPADSVQFTFKYSSSAAVGIKENTKSIQSFEMFPNPAKESTVLNIPSAKSSIANVQVYNAIGEIILQKEFSLNEGKNKVELDLQNISAGVYFVSVKNGNDIISKKLIIN